ncbi:MAG TPA: ComEC/Rec2 family competence protein, partial [Methyloceanibacter sp.]|nr:ComEC/Rec2 family competence protein [Methyloceanibacter sp.]
MPDRNEMGWGPEHAACARRDGVLSALLSFGARSLEAESDRWFLWLPVLFAGGIIAYFALNDEPSVRVAFALLLAALGLYLFARHAPLGFCLGGAALALAAGFATAKFRTETVRAPVLAQELRYVQVTGFVESHELRDKARARLTLRVLKLGDLPAEQRPYRVRLTMPASESVGLSIGTVVALQATLAPPPEPIAPGGFDFARQAWFDRLGATGYATSSVTVLEHAKPPPWDLAIWARIDAVRAAANARIRAVLPGETGEIACALITGERGGIGKDVTEAMRDSGLAHILSISGLHMALMAGTVFWFARALLALIPVLALRYPIKKWAAAISLAAACFYLALSGAAVPTVRSWIMMSIVLVALMLDRPALTIRNVALAALVILVAAPESLFDPSFEMSFAAVIALVALYEWMSQRPRRQLSDVSPFFRVLNKGWSLFAGAALTTLVAG